MGSTQYFNSISIRTDDGFSVGGLYGFMLPCNYDLWWSISATRGVRCLRNPGKQWGRVGRNPANDRCSAHSNSAFTSVLFLVVRRVATLVEINVYSVVGLKRSRAQASNILVSRELHVCIL